MFSLALRNLLIRKARTGLAAAGLVIALLGMIALVSLSGGVELLLRETLEILPGVMVLKKDLPSPALSTVSEEYTAQVAAIPGVIAAVPEIIFPAPSIDGSSLLRSGDPFKMYVVLGVYPAEIAQLPGGGLFARKLLRGRANNAGAAEVMMPRAATEAFEKDVGDVINIGGHDLTITGVFEIGSLLLDRGLVIDMALARE
ncbi:MAG: ABC transporter permease, partial [Planctomycetota bacterium]